MFQSFYIICIILVSMGNIMLIWLVDIYYVSVFLTDNRKSSGLPVAGIVAVVCSCLVLTACGSVAGIFVYRRWSIHIELGL